MPLQQSNNVVQPVTNPAQDLVGCTFLLGEHDGHHFCAHIVECINEQEQTLHQTEEHIKFWCSVNEDEYEEIILYNELMILFRRQNAENDQIIWRFKEIMGQPTKDLFQGSGFSLFLLFSFSSLLSFLILWTGGGGGGGVLVHVEHVIFGGVIIEWVWRFTQHSLLL